jgi:hypothetical protein
MDDGIVEKPVFILIDRKFELLTRVLRMGGDRNGAKELLPIGGGRCGLFGRLSGCRTLALSLSRLRLGVYGKN